MAAIRSLARKLASVMSRRSSLSCSLSPGAASAPRWYVIAGSSSSSSRASSRSVGIVSLPRNALSRLHAEDVYASLQRHACGDWGELCPEDVAENELALKEGFRLFSASLSSD